MKSDRIPLSEAQRSILEEWADSPATPPTLALRARIVLACAEEHSHAAVAAQLGTSPRTVAKWRSRFREDGPEGLRDQSRPGAPRRLGAPDLERLVAVMLLARPPSGGRWSTRALASVCGMSQSAVSRARRGLAPASAGAGDEDQDATAREMSARFERVLALYLDTLPEQPVLVHRVASRNALLAWLDEIQAARSGRAGASLVLADCGPAAEDDARRWLQGSAAPFELCVAPRGSRWVELMRYWFPPEGRPAPRRGRGRLVVEVPEQSCVWTPLGRARVQERPLPG